MSTYNLNEDTSIICTVHISSVSAPAYQTDNGTDVYTIEIKNIDDLGGQLGRMYHACLGMTCLNADEIHKELTRSRILEFTSIQKPLVSGADEETGEFNRGDRVKVSCRFEATPGDVQDSGQYYFPKLVLRFVDIYEESAQSESTPIEVEVPTEYDF